MRHPVNTGDIHKGNLSYVCEDIDDLHVILAKENLKEEGLGYVVEAVENHADTNTYATSFADSGPFSRAYTEDMLDCLSIAFEQHKRAMTDCDLSDVLKWIIFDVFTSLFKHKSK